MDSEYAEFFAQQEASLEQNHALNAKNANEGQTGEMDYAQWVPGQYQVEGQQQVPQQQGGTGEVDLQAEEAKEQEIVSAMTAGGYSPSVPQERPYSPSAPFIPQQGYSPSAVLVPLADESRDGSSMKESREPSQEAPDTQAPSMTTAAVEPMSDVQLDVQAQTAQATQSEKAQAPSVFIPAIKLESLGVSDPRSRSVAIPSIDPTPAVTPINPQPVTTPAITVNDDKPLTPIQAAQARTRRNVHDQAAWKEYLTLAEDTGDLEQISEAYEDALKAFPNTACIQIAYLNHYLTPALFQKAEALFARFLRPSPSVELWKFYLTYVRRINTNTSDATIRDIVRKAYEFALNHVGHDMDAGQIWRDYIDFLKNNLDSRTTWNAQQRMDALRSAYHRAVVIPLDNVEALWRELDQFENGLNKITAKKFLQDLSPAYMTAKTALRDLKRQLAPIATPTSSTAGSPASFNLPPSPTWTGDADRQLLAAWKNYLKWEEGNPLALEDQGALQLRIVTAYRKAVARMRFFPDISYLAYHTLSGMNKQDEAISILKQGLDSNPSSYLLAFAYAEYQEMQKNFSDVRTTYEGLIEVWHNKLEELEQQVQGEIQAARASVLHGGMDTTDDSAAPAVIEAEERARKVKERRAKDVEQTRIELGIAWIMLMRFSRRSEGLKPARAVFAKARKDKYCAWNVYEAAALMEYHCTKATDVATKIFEIGLKQFGDQVEFVVRYLGFLISINDENNARALFERTITTFPGESGRELWERWARYEYHFSDLAATQKLEARIAEALPSDPPVKRFALKTTYLGIDVIANRDLGFGVRGGGVPGGKKDGSGTPPSTTTNVPGQGQGSAGANGASPNATSKRAASPARRRDPSPPSKRFKGTSPPPAGRSRDWDRERGRDAGRRNFSPRRGDPRRDADAVPEGVLWFLGTLPSAAAFDGPKFRTEDLMHLFKIANLPHVGGPSEPRRSRSPPPRTGRPPPDYGPYQGPGGSRGGRRY